MIQYVWLLLLLLWMLWRIPGLQSNLTSILATLSIGRRRTKNEGLFHNNYFQAKAFYLQQFGKLPCSSGIEDVMVEKIIAYINDGNAGKVEAAYQNNYYNWKSARNEFTRTIFVLGQQVIIDVGTDDVEILFGSNQYEYVNNLLEFFKSCRADAKEEAFEINIITLNSSGLELKQLTIQPTQLNLDLYYNDDFAPVDAVIKARQLKDNDKGIILLHGLPGTGKTTYLRHLIGSLKKRALFVSPGVAENLMNPEFLDLLIDNPNAVLIIEDAENIIMDRRRNDSSSVSNLLNLSDGLLSDCLNVQIICTFNSALPMVDKALTRKGRLIARYEFGKLSAIKAQRLSNHLGFNNDIDKPMTLAEITHPGEQEDDDQRIQVMGFRREEVLAN